MKKFNLSLVAVLAMSTFAIAGGDIAPMEPVIETPVMAEPVASVGNFYVGLGYSYMNMNVEIGTYEADASANSVLLLAGYNFNQYIGIEGRYSMNVGDITVSETGAPDTDYSDDFSNFGIYLKPMYPVSNEFNVYALLGYGEVTVDDGPISDSEAGFQWGLGANYAITGNVSIFADYTRFYDDTGFDSVPVGDFMVDSISVGVTYNF